MALSLPMVLALSSACAPQVAPPTLAAVAQVESALDPLVIGVNGAGGSPVTSRSVAEAVQKAKAFIAAGRNVDLGLAQINSRNLPALNLTVEAAFDPCRNLAAAAQLLQIGYGRSQAAGLGEQPALRTALSLYNTGDPSRGFANGYVGKVTRAAAHVVPSNQVPPEGRPPPEPASPQAWDVFGPAAASSDFVIHVSNPEGSN